LKVQAMAKRHGLEYWRRHLLGVNAKPSAVGFYQQYGFEQMSDHPNNLFLPI